MQQFIYDTYDIEIAACTISSYLGRVKWSRKVVRARAAEQSKPLRIAWQGLQAQWDEEQLVFLDESASNERTGDRKMGWSPVGLECEAVRPIKRSERWSILPVLTNEGYLDWLIYQDSITADLFVQFIQERVLPYCEPFPGRRSVLIMDNATIHKDKRIKVVCDAAGVLLQFLLSYSPDFNPIESTFKDLKAWVKRNYQLAVEFDFPDFLNLAVQQQSKREVRGHYRACGYVVNSL